MLIMMIIMMMINMVLSDSSKYEAKYGNHLEIPIRNYRAQTLVRMHGNSMSSRNECLSVRGDDVPRLYRSYLSTLMLPTLSAD